MTIENERAILATVITNPTHAAAVFTRIPVHEFSGEHLLVAEAIHAMRTARQPIDPSTVATEMRKRSTLSRFGSGNAAAVYQLAEFYVPGAALEYHIDAVADEIRLRKLWKIGAALTQHAGQADADSLALAQTTAEQVQAVIDNAEADRDVTTETLAEFLAGEDDPADWVIPGLLERGDRFILTGSEGLGKSVLFRQIAVGAAAGIHPFTLQRITPNRVLYVDVENSRMKLRRDLRQLRQAAKQSGGDPDENLLLECRPEGLDLTRPEDEAWLLARVTAIQPAILITGPLYRLHAKNPNDEEPARKVAAVLDRCRAAANCALVLEAHAGHQVGHDGKRNVRPTGTSLWLRWPEFGYGIRPTEDFTEDNRLVDFVAWRGDRDERDWPTRLRRGGSWPWQVATDPNQSWKPYPTPNERSA